MEQLPRAPASRNNRVGWRGFGVTYSVRHQRQFRWVASAALALVMVGLPACHRQIKEPKAQASAPKAPAPRIIVLPDSAIAVRKGSPEEQLADFLASDDPAPRTFRFEGSEYEPWSSKPNVPTLRMMYAMTQILRAYPNTRMTLAGYTDNDGTAAQNLALASERVDRMAEILVHGGVRPSRIQTVGKGAVDFIGDNATPEGKARNRRIELTVTAK
jgi:outer membrane protein OmpA-like peptidoglycan-associated protein